MSGYRVDTALDADAAITLLKKHAFALLVLRCPHAGEREKLRLVRDAKRICGRMPVVLYSGDLSASLLRTAEALDVAACVDKSGGFDTLLGAIREALRSAT